MNNPPSSSMVILQPPLPSNPIRYQGLITPNPHNSRHFRHAYLYEGVGFQPNKDGHPRVTEIDIAVKTTL